MKSTHRKGRHTKHRHTKKCKHVKKHKHTKKCKRMRSNGNHMRSNHMRSNHKHTKRCSHSRMRSNHLRGGYGPGAGPLGYAWLGKDVCTWPGVARVDGQSNYLPLSKYGITAGLPDSPMSTSNRQYGGGLTDLFPQDLVNFGRSLTGSVQGAVFGVEGVERPYSTISSPYIQPGMNATQTNYSSSLPPNISAIHQAAGRTVAGL